MTRAQAQQLTRALGIAVAVLAVLYVLLLAGFGRGVPRVEAGAIEPVPALQLSEAQVELPGLDVFQDIAQRPLFADDRRPRPKEVQQEAEEAPPEAPPTIPLNVALTGIIHTPGTRVVLLRDNMTGRHLHLGENMPLPGDQGAWVVKTIGPRQVVFKDTGSDNEQVLELAIGAASSVPAPPPPAPPRQAVAPGQAPQPPRPTAEAPAGTDDEVARRAAEIRRRIEERRAQLRREAEQNRKR
jgi:general secretion pathway protein N